MEQRAELLRKLMEEKNMKVADIVRISGLPYSTVKAILELKKQAMLMYVKFVMLWEYLLMN